jgi:hypothetical protein
MFITQVGPQDLLPILQKYFKIWGGV